MTHHGNHQGHSHHGHSHANHAELAQTLDLDAAILGSYLREAAAWAADVAAAEPASIIDVGAGSGVGTLALAEEFPKATITALDHSADMLAKTLSAAATSGFAHRVNTLEADLNENWPAGVTADLMWASSSLHEVANPERLMQDMYAHLNPGGLLVVMEMDSLPSFLPTQLPVGSGVEPGVEERLHATLLRSGWNHHPDWTAGLEGAGFVVERRNFPTVGSTTPELAARYGRIFLSRIREAVAETASPEDLASLAILLGDGPQSLEQRGDLLVQGNRTGWAARKPLNS